MSTSAELTVPATPGGVSQFRRDGSLRHLLTLEGIPLPIIEGLLDRAQGFVRTLGKQRPASSQALHGVTVANLFTEPSTRTRVSFELAAKRLGADVVNLEVQLSSRVKGESMLDTVCTLESLHVDVLVIREAEAGVLDLVAANVAPHVSVLSAGESHVSHPTQGLLDALTVRQYKKRFDNLVDRHRRRHPAFARRALGVSGVPHARRAGSAHRRAAGVHAEAGRVRRLLAPRHPQGGSQGRGRRHDVAHPEGAHDARLPCPTRIATSRNTGSTPERLAVAKPDAIVMHPQPMNRGIEIASDVADGTQSVIRDQVRNGVAVRMAVLQTVMERVTSE